MITVSVPSINPEGIVIEVNSPVSAAPALRFSKTADKYIQDAEFI